MFVLDAARNVFSVPLSGLLVSFPLCLSLPMRIAISHFVGGRQPALLLYFSVCCRRYGGIVLLLSFVSIRFAL